MTSRRTFLQMLGIGGMGVVASDALALPLFGSDADRGLWVPGSSKLLDGHWVVAQKNGFIERPLGGVPQPAPDGLVVARLIKHHRPSRYFAQRTVNLNQPLHNTESREELHTAYFMAAMQERQRFAQQSLEFLSSRPTEPVVLREHKYQPWSQKFALVTIVEQPIRCEWYSGSEYHLTGSYTQYLVQDEPEEVMRTFEIYSEHGDFPIDAPYRTNQSLEVDALAKASAAVAPVASDQRENAARSFFKRLFS